ncbi:ABC transporter substrate-binding protein [Spelaeicoccus albus]|nr:glycine betaine ABC transporter substrate-binding protein [Spelaeicoccus albus]
MFNRTGGAGSRPWRGAIATATLVALSLGAAGCSGNSKSNAASTSSSSSSSKSSNASSNSSKSSGSGLSPVTAHNVSLPNGTPGQGKPSVTIGDKNFPEEFLLGDLYQIALKAKGYTVTVKPNIGGSEIIDTSFKSGQIDLYPEYLGEIVSSVAKKSPQKSDVATYNAAKKFEQSHRNATLLKQTPFQDVDVLFVKTAFAKANNLKSVGDLTNVGAKGQGVTYVAQPPSRTRFAGLKGLQKAYGLTKVNFVGAPPGQQYKAINKGQGNVGDAFSTDPAFASGVNAGKYLALNDTKHIMGFQHVAPVVKQSVVKAEGPQFTKTLNWVSSLLTLKAVQTMDIAVQTHHKDASTVAQKFLEANGLNS